jgi:NAD(P)-dependent dehydrogenase (short-subunit alcohol dehydrogenase family)
MPRSRALSEFAMAVALKPLNEQVIVVTGASSGIGLATAYRAAEQGARVVLASRNGDTLAKIVREIRDKGGKATHVVTDASRRKDLERLSAAAIKAFGGFDTWVNDAGLGIFARLEEISDEDARRLFDVNFWGVVYGTQIAAAHLKKRGGAIINLGSIASEVGLPLQGMYSASKHAVEGFTDAFRMEVEEAGAPISITLIRPISIDTPFPLHARNYMQGRPTLPPPVYTPEDVADAILHAAVHGGRDYYIGGGAKLISALNKFVPAAVDWMGAHVLSKQSVKDKPPGRDPEGALYAPGDDGQARGGSDRLARRSLYTKASMHPILTGALATGAGVAAAALFTFRGR